MLLQKMTRKLLEEMYDKHHKLMNSIRDIIYDEDEKEKHSQYYDKLTHNFLIEKAWEILLPVPEEEWFENLQDVNKYNKDMPWPQYAPYQYSGDILFPPNMEVSSLYFGYAILEDDTVQKTCFFVREKIVDYQAMPQGIVMDPLAKLHNISVNYYVGLPIEKEDLESFRLRIPGHPLENYVKRRCTKG